MSCPVHKKRSFFAINGFTAIFFRKRYVRTWWVVFFSGKSVQFAKIPTVFSNPSLVDVCVFWWFHSFCRRRRDVGLFSSICPTLVVEGGGACGGGSAWQTLKHSHKL